jgi:thiamine-phosphate pyrophosphorylase
MPRSFPRVYPILDASILPAEDRAALIKRLGGELTDAGVTLLEYRNKTGSEAELIADCETLRSAMPAGGVRLILDDRVDLVARLEFDGVHVDAGDASPAEARRLLGPNRIIGTFGGSEALVEDILLAPVDYLSIGPVFSTRTKQTTRAPIGVEGVRWLRAQTGPGPVLVAVGGITRATAAQAILAGADVVAVSEGIFGQPDPATEFRAWVAELGDKIDCGRKQIE